MGKFRTTSYTQRERQDGKHRFEHWYRDNTIYFITSKARDSAHVFKHQKAQDVFWDRFTHWTSQYGFDPFITTLMSNHYHTVGHLHIGSNLGPLMQRLHGSVSKLVNDTLPIRHLPFWRTKGNKDYFDGCLRDAKQLDRTYRYVLTQAVRARLVRDPSQYTNTKIGLSLELSLKRAEQSLAYLPMVPYARYTKPNKPK